MPQLMGWCSNPCPLVSSRLGIHSFAHCPFAHSLRSLKSNERLWVLHWYCSGQMRDCERIAQVAHVKRATLSKSLRSLILSFLTSDVSESLRLLNKNEWCEQVSQVAHQKWVMWANRSGCSPKMSELLVFLSKALFRSIFRKKLVICSENRWANSRPWVSWYILFYLNGTKNVPQLMGWCSNPHPLVSWYILLQELVHQLWCGLVQLAQTVYNSIHTVNILQKVLQ